MQNFKKLIYCCFMLTLLSGVTYGQNAFGGKIGIQLATWDGDEEIIGDNLESILGFQLGAFFEIGITETFSIQPEFLFIQKGVKSSIEETIFGETIKAEDAISLNYVEVPVLAKIDILKGEGTQFFIVAGPSFGYALSGKQKSKLTASGTTETSTDDIEFGDDDGFARFDISAALGAGVSIPAGPGRFILDARYLFGLSNLFDEDDEDFKVKNRGFGLTAGFAIPLGGE